MADELNGVSQGSLEGLAKMKTSMTTLSDTASDGLGGLTKLMDTFLQLFNSVTSGVKGIVDPSKIEKPKFPMKSDWVKFSSVENFIRKQYPVPISYSDSFSVINSQTCDELVTKLLDMLETKKLEFSVELYPIDEILVEYLGPMLSKFLDMFSLLVSFCSFSVSGLGQVISWITSCLSFLFDMISWIMSMLATPFFKEIDQLYVMYRQLKVTAAIQLFSIKQYTLSPSVIECEYIEDQSKCPTLKKLQEGLNSFSKNIQDGLAGPFNDIQSQMKDKMSMIGELKNTAQSSMGDIKEQYTATNEKMQETFTQVKSATAMEDIKSATSSVKNSVSAVSVSSRALFDDLFGDGEDEDIELPLCAEQQLKDQKEVLDLISLTDEGAVVADSLKSLENINFKECPVHKAITTLASIIDSIAGFIDGLTSPIEAILEMVNTIIESVPPISVFMPRRYPPVYVIESMEILQAIVDESKEQIKNGLDTNPVSHGQETETGASLMQWSAWGDVFTSPFDGLLNNTPEDKAIEQIESDIAFNKQLKNNLNSATVALSKATEVYKDKLAKKDKIPAEKIIDAKMQMERAQKDYDEALSRYNNEQKKIPEGYAEWNSALPNLVAQTGNHFDEMVDGFTDFSQLSSGFDNLTDTWSKTFGEERDKMVEQELNALEKKNEEIKEYNKNVLITQQQAKIDEMNKDLLAMGTEERKSENISAYMSKIEELEKTKKELERIQGLSTKTSD